MEFWGDQLNIFHSNTTSKTVPIKKYGLAVVDNLAPQLGQNLLPSSRAGLQFLQIMRLFYSSVLSSPLLPCAAQSCD
jgi:hypothetical protein